MFSEIISYISYSLAVFGAIFVFYGGIRAVIKVIIHEIRGGSEEYNDIRLDFTTKIVLSLEFFIAADLVKSILQPTFNDVILLAIIVAIRTVVGYSLNSELKDLSENK
ncbi:putative membrane protein [Methanobacterium sp. MB1]|jgi:uncharacterized membrane protein|uniref:DUF1622 domain-containing protein n=1 Tax=Methanobacterium sp. TaxID=2164 RepID=UPI0003C9DB5A|nr:DUF1622 domain-containing protein [uncultured Methanobacterium sp.]CDG65981.1 putative membrane protein [Methanobacterium sp. MB1]